MGRRTPSSDQPVTAASWPHGNCTEGNMRALKSKLYTHVHVLTSFSSDGKYIVHLLHTAYHVYYVYDPPSQSRLGTSHFVFTCLYCLGVVYWVWFSFFSSFETKLASVLCIFMYLCLAVRRVRRYPLTTTLTKMGTISGRKSAPMRLNESPKYIHCERRESSRPDTPRARSDSSTRRNSFTCTQTQPHRVYACTFS